MRKRFNLTRFHLTAFSYEKPAGFRLLKKLAEMWKILLQLVSGVVLDGAGNESRTYTKTQNTKTLRKRKQNEQEHAKHPRPC